MTLKHSVVSTLLVLLGFAAGWLLKPAPQTAANSALTLAAHSAADIAATPAELPQAADTSEIDALRAQLADALSARAALEQQARQLADKGQRYDYIRKKLLTQNHLLHFGLKHETLEPSEHLVELLGLDAATRARVEAVGQNALNRIKDWEQANRVTLEDSDDRFVVEIAPYEETIAEDYRSELSSLLPAEDAELVATAATAFFQELESSRQLEVIITEENDRQKIAQTVKLFDSNGRQISSSGSTSYLPHTNIFPDDNNRRNRWTHLYRLSDSEE